jgi:LPS-assembly lipoprotein
MSSAEAGPARVALNRRALTRGLLLLLAVAPALASCGEGSGFRPLYGPTASGVGLQERLSQVDIAPIPGRVGQRIRNELIFHNTGGAESNSAPPTHRLEVTIRESVQSTLVNISGEALGQIYAIEASFRLISIKDKKVVLQGASHGRAPFERFESIYSNVRAREDAENRVARTVSEDLKIRLATYLSGAA